MARSAGADAADAALIDASSIAISWRDKKLEALDRAESGDLGLRVFIGKKQALVSSSDRKPETLKALVERAIAMARLAPDDAFCGIADPDQIAHDWPQIEMVDPRLIDADALIALAKEAEDAALSVPQISQCDSIGANTGSSSVYLVASNGFSGTAQRSGFSISAAVMAGTGTTMERDYDFASAIFFEDLPGAATIGRKAAERAARRLNARKMPTAQVPVVFEPRVANSLLGHLAGAISGTSIARGTSFLLDKLNEQIFPENITIFDDPSRKRGLRSRLFDGEGLAPQVRKIVDQGRLTSWLLDLRSARQLGLQSTAHASRGASSPPSPSPSNFYLAAGTRTPQELIKNIKQGLYVTDLMGMGVNGVTGDYSRACSGLWIENGEISFPVNEITIASNLKDMFRTLHAANDLTFRQGVDAPTLMVENMTLAGL